jgi:FKBP-type peptidyl-prolyl cis-trans isomerase
MKITPILTLCLLSFGLAAAARAQEIKFSAPGDQPAAPAATPPAVDATAPAAASFSSVQLSEEAGWAVAKQSGVGDMGFNSDEIDAFMKGFSAAVNGKPSPYDLKTIVPQMNAFMSRKQAAYLQQLRQQNQTMSEQFFATAKQDKDVVVLPSGLCYKILTPGSGAYPAATEIVKVNYTGRLVDGTIFDSSEKHGQPAEFQLDQVIPGWTEGIQKINRGGKIRLFIPSGLAYGDEGRPGIPPGATLIFDVELLDIKPGNPTPAAGAPPPPASAP